MKAHYALKQILVFTSTHHSWKPYVKSAKDLILEWKTKQPDQEGWYFFRHSVSHGIQVAKIYRATGRHLVIDVGQDKENFLQNYTGQWAGPISEPLEQ